MAHSVDIAIIGGGIAGSSLAIVLQRAGFTTAAIERESVFRDRVRGEACHPWGTSELRALELESFVTEAGGVELPLWSVYHDRELESQFAWGDAFAGAPPAMGFSHPKVQQTLIDGARAAGALVFRPARAAIARAHDVWHLRIDSEQGETDLQARFLVAADGKASATRRLWNGETISDPVHHQFGGMLVRNLDLQTNSAHQGFHDAGFSMIFPQGDDAFRVYYVGPGEPSVQFAGEQRTERYLAACAACFPEGTFANAEVAGPLAFFPNAHVSTSRIGGEMAVAIGDAAGAPDPTQGHGTSMVWRDVRILRDLLLSEEWQDVPHLFETARRSYETILRTHAAWVAPLTTETSDDIIALKSQVEKTRDLEPEALGYTSVFALGPDSQPTDDDARARFFGEHNVDNPVRVAPQLDKIG